MSTIYHFIKFIFNTLSQGYRPKPPYTPPSPDNVLNDLFKLHNEQRTQRGFSELIIDNRLSIAAAKHASWMCDHKTMSHSGLNGTNHADRIKTEGYKSSYSGENVAFGYTSAKAVFDGWMNSRGHRTNILSARYMHVGFGMKGNYWCTVFATPGSFSVADGLPYEPAYESGPLANTNQP